MPVERSNQGWIGIGGAGAEVQNVGFERDSKVRCSLFIEMYSISDTHEMPPGRVSYSHS